MTVNCNRLLLLAFALLAAALAVALSLRSSHTTRGVEPAGGSTSVAFDPPSQSVGSGSNAIVSVDLNNVSDPDGLGAYEFAVVFEPAVLTFQSYSNGNFLGSTGRSVLPLPPLLDRNGDTVPDPGYVRIGAVSSGVGAGPVGSGLLATLTFSTSCAGMSSLTFDLVNMSDPLGDDIVAGSAGGSVTVTGGSVCPTPTEEPTPATTPGDVNCGTSVDAVDAVLILQKTAGLLQALPCPQNGDVNDDSSTNAIDATLVLQLVASLIDHF